jgi:predicted transport protein
MSIFSISNDKLKEISEKKFNLENDIQSLTEKNLDTIFGLKFVSGSLNQEFSIRAQEQDFYIDTLAFDEAQKSFIIIEYKKDKSFSVIDQGFAYLSAMLNHKADFVLELNERLHKNFTKKDIDWESSRVIFVSPEFTNYQKNAINFKDLPIYLYEAKLYDNHTILYNPIKPYRTSEPIGKFSKDKTTQNVLKEVKVYTLDDVAKPSWTDSRELLEEFENQLLKNNIETRTKYTKQYIAYSGHRGKEWVNYVEIVPQQQGLKIYYRFPVKYLESTLIIEDCSKKGHWTNGISYIYLNAESQIPEAVRLSVESYKFLYRDTKDGK